MKKIRNILVLACLTLLLPGCFEDETQRLLFEEEQQINTERNAFYAMTGILQQLQEIGDNYVIMGELRGDLMDVTENSSQELRDINSFSADSTNSYVVPKKYYTLINNCNNLITKLDTSVVTNGSQTLKSDMKVAKTIRAWTYLQLYQIFGKVYYYNQTMLDVNDQQNYTEITDFTELSDTLIAELKPWLPADGIAEQFPTNGSLVSGVSTPTTIGLFLETKLYIPTRFVLGELYLMRGEYGLAANMYYQILRTNSLGLLNKKNTWNSTQTGLNTAVWPQLFTDLTNGEQLSVIGYSSEYSNNTQLPELVAKSTYMLAPSNIAVKTWEDQTYSISNTSVLQGDLRGRQGSYSTFTQLNELNDNESYKYITKYANTANYVTICRSSLIYLRYAEAINRYGKPNMAFAFLKYGLNKLNMENVAYVPAKELKSKESFIDFGQTKSTTDPVVAMFNSNTGIRSRGCGAVDLNNSFKIPAGSDSIAWVEDQLVTEYALETAFEGNRFNDLMRIANRRNDPVYLATKVASKFPEDQQSAILQKLSNKKNWFLPLKK